MHASIDGCSVMMCAAICNKELAMFNRYSASKLRLNWLCVFLAITFFAVLTGFASQDSKFISKPSASLDKPTVLITGANRGLGLEFAKQYHEAGYNVIATARKPDAAEELNAIGVQVEQLDVTDAKSVSSLAKRLVDTPLDILINNAGVGGARKPIAEADIKAIERIIAVNTLGPIRVTQALIGNLREGEQKLIINITSLMGSIERNARGIGYGYRESKAALNMFTKSLSNELKDEGFRCIVMSPGWVKTDMGGRNARLTPQESISGMIEVISGLSAEDTGEFFNHTGEKLPW